MQSTDRRIQGVAHSLPWGFVKRRDAVMNSTGISSDPHPSFLMFPRAGWSPALLFSLPPAPLSIYDAVSIPLVKVCLPSYKIKNWLEWPVHSVTHITLLGPAPCLVLAGAALKWQTDTLDLRPENRVAFNFRQPSIETSHRPRLS